MFFFFPFLGQKTYQVRIYNTQNLSQFQSIQQQNLSQYQAKIFSNLSQFQSISLTKFEEVQMFKESSITTNQALIIQLTFLSYSNFLLHGVKGNM